MDVQYEGEKNREFFNRKIEEYDATHATFMKTKMSYVVICHKMLLKF